MLISIETLGESLHLRKVTITLIEVKRYRARSLFLSSFLHICNGLVRFAVISIQNYLTLAIIIKYNQ